MPELVQPVDHVADAERVGEDRALGHLELEPVGGDARVGEHRRDPVGQLEIEQVGDGQVDGDVEVEPVGRPRGALVDRRPQHVARERLDQAGALGDPDEPGRRDEAPLGMDPADERLDAHDPAGLEVGLRLVVDDELLLLDRAAQLARERQPLGVVRVLLGAVDGRAGVRALGDVHRDVGVLEQRVRVLPVLAEDGDADARGHLEREAAELERLLERLVDAGGEAVRELRRACGSRTANSSPPSRATVSSSQSAASRSPMPRRSSSPSSWPSASLTSLKWSTSSRSTAASSPVPLAPTLAAEERPVREAGELVVVHLAPDPKRHAPEDRHERDEEQDQHYLEDAGDREEGRVRGARDRCVVLVDGDDARAAAHGNRGVGAE